MASYFRSHTFIHSKFFVYKNVVHKGGDTQPAIHSSTRAVSAGSNADFKILLANTAKIDYQLCSIFDFRPQFMPEISVLQTLRGEVAHANVAAIASYQLFSGFRCNSAVY